MERLCFIPFISCVHFNEITQTIEFQFCTSLFHFGLCQVHLQVSVSFQGCPVLNTNQQPYRICRQGLRACLDCHSAETEMSGDLYLFLWGINQRYGGSAGWTLSATPALSGGRIGGGTAACGPRAKVNLCSSPRKISVSKLQSKL